jgi:hypothetical protein
MLHIHMHIGLDVLVINVQLLVTVSLLEELFFFFETVKVGN